MFTYLNPEVREKLVAQGRLVRINSEGELMDVKSPDHPGELAINLLGPIPVSYTHLRAHETKAQLGCRVLG